MGRLRPLKRDGARKVLAGVTSATEVMRVAGVDATVPATV
jgi:type II secretory ATPase GspE/PulE/Tfp pilus assembly ATPase PilB-like protein